MSDRFSQPKAIIYNPFPFLADSQNDSEEDWSSESGFRGESPVCGMGSPGIEDQPSQQWFNGLFIIGG